MAQVTAQSVTATPGKIHSFSAKAAAALNTINLRIKYGSTVLLSSGTVTIPTTGTNVAWEIEGEFVVRSIGGSGTVMTTGRHDNGQTSGLLANTAAIVVDTTASADLQVSAQWGTASASNIIKVQNLTVEING